MQQNNDILQNFRDGNVAPLYMAMYRQLMLFAQRFLGSQLAFLAEDCVQDAVFGAWQTRHSFRSDSNLSAYLYSAVRNKAVDALRKCNSYERYRQNLEITEDPILPAIIEHETMEHLFEAVDALPEKDKELFFLCSKGLSISQIAKELGLAESTVKQHKARMLSKLHAAVKDKALLYALLLATSTWVN